MKKKQLQVTLLKEETEFKKIKQRIFTSVAEMENLKQKPKSAFKRFKDLRNADTIALLKSVLQSAKTK